jgi:hypothetical protein
MVRLAHDAESAPNYHRKQLEKKCSRFEHRPRLTEPDIAEEEERDHRSPGDRETDDESYASPRRHDVMLICQLRCGKQPDASLHCADARL